MSFLTQADKAIREAGRMTRQRQIILEALAESNEILDAESLYHLAKVEDDSVSLATVYRTLNVLEGVGLVKERYLTKDHERKYYETKDSPSEYIFTCRNCHKSMPFQTPLIDQLVENLEVDLGAGALTACICVTGLCPACQTIETD